MNTTTHECADAAFIDVATTAERLVIAEIPLRCDRLVGAPLALLETHEHVVVAAQTRHAIVAAAERAAAQAGDGRPGGLVGFHTLFAVSPHSERARLHYCAPGSTIARVAAHGGLGDGDVALVIDQAHQSRADQLMLLAAARAAIERGAPLRIILLGARLDTAALTSYVAGCERLECARVEFRDPGPRRIERSDVLAAVAEHAGDDVRLVAVVPTKAAVEQLAATTRARFPGRQVVALHSRSGRPAGRLAATWEGPMVLVTTELPAGLAGIDVVVDSGLVHRSSGTTGVTRPTSVIATSAAESSERAGLAAGRYVACATPSDVPFARSGFEAGGLARVLLRLAADGLETNEVRFLYEPERKLREHDLALLTALGAVDERGAPTPITRAMAELPLRPRLARMLVEAGALGVSRAMLKIAVVLENRELRARNELWRQHTGECAREDACDLFALLELYELADRSEEADLIALGIDPGAFAYAKRELRRRMRVLRLAEDTCVGGDRRAAVIRACRAGLVQVFERAHPDRAAGTYFYRGPDGQARRLLPWSVFGAAGWPQRVAGEALDRQLDGPGDGGHMHWVSAATAVLDAEPPTHAIAG
jgi:hypothetical protein